MENDHNMYISYFVQDKFRMDFIAPTPGFHDDTVWGISFFNDSAM